MSRTKPLTMEQHVTLSKEIDASYEAIHRAIRILSPVTPKNERALRRLWRISDAHTEARCDLENRMFREHGDDGSFDVYFGRRDKCRSD